jgi:hypothetical protein
MKKLFTILAVAFTLNANAQTTYSYQRNGLETPDSSGTGTGTLYVGPNGQCFSNAVNYSTGVGYNPKSLITADFNNDGKLDLAGTNYGASSVFVFLGTGAGTFGTVDSFMVCAFPSSPSNFSSICSADFNGDGFKDLAVGSVATNGVYILLGTGTGSFGTPTNFATGTTHYSIASADFNGDSKADLATVNYGSNNISILLGAGTGSFGAATNFIVGTNPQSVISADFNLDGKADLATANAGSNNVSILLGTGTGNFGATVNFQSANGPMSITGADFNNDSKLDLATTNGADTLSILLGTGTGSFGSPTKYFTPGMGSYYQGSIINADFNMDGNVDLATSDYAAGSGYASVFLGTGTGNFGTAGNFATGTNPFAIVAADFNMDGKPDLATANSSNYNVSILLNNPLDTISIVATASALCLGSNTTLTASGSTTYSWSTGATTSSVSVAPTNSTTYFVSDGVGCSNTASVTINVAVNTTPAICMVTTDSASNYNYNMIVWDKTLYSNVDSFIVYRYDVMSSSYLRIGAVSKSSLSELKDTAFSVGGPNGGNPLYSSWRYKLAIRDTCGNIGAMSPYHETMFVQESGATFSWNAYVGASVAGYSFLRDDNNTGAWHVLVNTAGLSSTDPNYSSYPNGNWRVDALGFNCTPTMFMAGNSSNTSVINKKSHSNTSKPTAVGIDQTANKNNFVNIYPNPSSNNVTIQSSTELGAITIYNSLGEDIFQTKTKNLQEQIDISKFSAGIYTVQVQGRYVKLVKD